MSCFWSTRRPEAVIQGAVNWETRFALRFFILLVVVAISYLGKDMALDTLNTLHLQLADEVPEEESTRGFASSFPSEGDQVFGLVYITYSEDSNTAMRFNDLVMQSAATYKLWNANLSIALITTLKNVSTPEGLIDHVIEIPAAYVSGGRQWLTRILALSLSPYRITAVVDSDTFCCAPIHRLFHDFSAQGLDFAVGSSNTAGKPIFPDNGVFIYRSTSGFLKIVSLWMYQQMKAGAEKDDQGTLLAALKSTRNVAFAQILPRGSLRWIPAQGETWAWGPTRIHDHTMVVTEEVAIVHMNGLVRVSKDICLILNRDAPTPRVFLWDRNTHMSPQTAEDMHNTFMVAFDQASCTLHLNATCRQLQWTPFGSSYFLPVREKENGALVAIVNETKASNKSLEVRP